MRPARALHPFAVLAAIMPMAMPGSPVLAARVMVRVSTNGSSYDTGVAVYMGTCGTLAEIGCAGDACFGDGTPSRVSCPAVGGTTYLIMVWGEAYPHSGTLVFCLSQVDVCEG
jgi:hypothetical protein